MATTSRIVRLRKIMALYHGAGWVPAMQSGLPCQAMSRRGRICSNADPLHKDLHRDGSGTKWWEDLR